MWEQAGIIIAVITGGIALLSVLFDKVFKLGGFNAWKKSVDAWMTKHEDEEKRYPPSETCLMVKTMWDIYVVGALRDRPDLATHQSPFKLTSDAEDLIPPKLKERLTAVAQMPYDKEALATGWLVVKHLGITTIEVMAKEKSLSVSEAIAVLSTFLDSHTNNCHPV